MDAKDEARREVVLRKENLVPPPVAQRVLAPVDPSDKSGRTYYLGPKTVQIDDQVVLVKWWARPYTGGETMIFVKPDEFDGRKFCGVISERQGGVFCKNKAGKCPLHCGSWAKQKGRPCKSTPIVGMTRCRFHGGKSPTGVAAPSFKTGGYSKSLPKNLREDYQKFMDLIDHLSLKPEVSLLRLQLEQANMRIGTGETEKAWIDLKRVMKEFDEAVQVDDQKKTQESITELRKIITYGAGIHAAHRESRKIALDLSAIATRESKIIQNREMTMNQAEALALFQSIMEAVKNRFSGDHKGMVEFSKDMQLLLNEEGSRKERWHNHHRQKPEEFQEIKEIPIDE